MTRTRLILGLFGAAILCGGVFFYVSDATVVPLVAKGAGPSGIQVTTGGWAAFFVSLLGTCGFSLSGLILWLLGHIQWGTPAPKAEEAAATKDVSEGQLLELAQSFESFLLDRASKATQRRFLFALVDSAAMIKGVETSHDNGVVCIKYTGYAEVTPPLISSSCHKMEGVAT